MLFIMGVLFISLINHTLFASALLALLHHTLNSPSTFSALSIPLIFLSSFALLSLHSSFPFCLRDIVHRTTLCLFVISSPPFPPRIPWLSLYNSSADFHLFSYLQGLIKPSLDYEWWIVNYYLSLPLHKQKMHSPGYSTLLMQSRDWEIFFFISFNNSLL